MAGFRASSVLPTLGATEVPTLVFAGGGWGSQPHRALFAHFTPTFRLAQAFLAPSLRLAHFMPTFRLAQAFLAPRFFAAFGGSSLSGESGTAAVADGSQQEGFRVCT